jgi:hypothetical protein
MIDRIIDFIFDDIPAYYRLLMLYIFTPKCFKKCTCGESLKHCTALHDNCNKTCKFYHGKLLSHRPE